MVLLELGNKINNALSKLHKSIIIDDAVLNECLKDIAVALL